MKLISRLIAEKSIWTVPVIVVIGFGIWLGRSANVTANDHIWLVGWSSLDSEATIDLAWGDADGDGDLDLAVGNWGVNQLYVNDGMGNFVVTTTFGLDNEQTYSVAWGDVDGDDDLDLAVGNGSSSSGSLNQLYMNDGNGAFTILTVPGVLHEDATYSVTWGDVNWDNQPDLVVGNADNVNRLYLNDGEGGLIESVGVFGSEVETSRDVAFGDVDGDGDLDLAVGNMGSANLIYVNEVEKPVMNPPWVLVFDVNEANPYQIATPDEVVEFSLAVEVADPDGDETIVQYRVDVDENDDGSIDETFNWLPSEAVPSVLLGKGCHLLRLIVTDETGLTAEYARPVCLYEEISELEDRPPVVNVNAPSPAEVFTSWPVLFSGEAIPDYNSTIVSYTWVLGNGSTRTGAEVQYTYSTAGIYEVYLQVEDNDGFVTKSDVMTVTVTQTDEPPPTPTMTIALMTGTPTHTPTPTSTLAPCSVRFEGTLTENQVVIPVTGDVGAEIMITDLTTDMVLAGPLIMAGPFDGHLCDGFLEVRLAGGAKLIKDHVILVESSDGSFDVMIVQPIPITPTTTATQTPGPSPTPKAADADLIIGKPTLITAPPIENGMPLTFTVEITNTGAADVTDLFFVDLFFDVPEDQIEPSGISIEYSNGYRAVDGLTAGASRTITVTSSLGFSDGANPYTVHAMVDSVLQIAETNEENNVGEVIFVDSVSTTPTATPTATMSPSQTATPTATPAPSVTPTPQAVNVDYFIYLPFVRLDLD